MPSVEPKKPTHTHSQTLPPLRLRPSSLVALPAFSLQLSSSREHSGLSPVSEVRLPCLISQVGPRRALHGSKWTQGPQLVASALGTELPVIRRSVPEPEQMEQPRKSQTRRGPVSFRKARVPGGPVNVEEVLYLLSTAGAHHRGPQMFYLREEPGPVRRPYDLCVVAPSKAGSEHYIFCRSCVLHVTLSGYGGITSLARWYREAIYWHALHKMPFFRLFKLRKAFCWWRLHVRRCLFLRRCEQLQSLLLIDSTPYRAALFGLARALQEVQVSFWLPQSGSYRVIELCDALQNQKKHFQCKLGLLSKYCRDVLLTVQEESHRLLHQLQCHFKLSQEAKHFCGPVHLHQRHQHELKRALRTAEHALSRWDSFTRLVDYMTVGSMVTSIQQDVANFSYNVLQTQSLRFQTELTLSAQRQLSLEPGLHQFHAVLRDLLTAKDFLIQACDMYDFSDEPSLQDLVYSCALDVDFFKHATTYNPDSTRGTAQEFWCCHCAQNQQSLFQQQNPGLEQQSGAPGQLEAQTHVLGLNRELLEWTLNMCDLSEPVGAAEHLIQEELDLGWLYHRFSWLLEVQEFVEACSPGQSGAPRGPSAEGVAPRDPSAEGGDIKDEFAEVYKELIIRVQGWLGVLRSAPPSVSSTKQLFLISCTGITHKLEEQLKVIDEELLACLVGEVSVWSQKLISELEQPASDLLLTQHDFTQYAVKVKQWFSLWPGLKQRLDSTRSLQDLIVSHYRELRAEEQQQRAQIEHLWNHFHVLLQAAESAVCLGLPINRHTLDLLFSFSFCDLTQMLSQLSHGDYQDPGQEAVVMSSRLHVLWTHVQMRQARLEQLSLDWNLLQETPKDLSRLSRVVQKVKARKELWEALAASAKWLDKWKLVLFIEMDVVRAKGELEERSQRVQCVSSHIPLDDAVLQRALNELQQQCHQLEVLSQLKESCLKHKHWRAILRGIGLNHVKEGNLTVEQLLSQRLEQHQSVLKKIFRDAKAEHNMECDFQKLQKQWSEKLLTLAPFPVSSAEPQGEGGSSKEHTWTITDIEIHLAQIHFDLAILSNMFKSLYSDDFRAELDHWLQLLHDLENILYLLKRFQQMWTYLTMLLNSSSMSVLHTDLFTLFKPVDSKFLKMMAHISRDPHVMSLASNHTAQSLLGDDLLQSLTSGLCMMDIITTQTVQLLDSVRSQCSRLRFLSDRELILVLSTPPSPSSILPIICKLFRGVQELECTGSDASFDSQATLGVRSQLQERLTFVSPVEPCLKPAKWLSDFEKQLHLTMVECMRECSIVKEQLGPPQEVISDDRRLVDTKLSNDIAKQIKNMLELLATHPSQCLEVAEEAMWCSIVEDTFTNPVKVNKVKFYLRSKVAELGRIIRDREMLQKVSSVTLTCACHFLRALVQMTMNHSEMLTQLQGVQGLLHSSFEWLSLFKYHISVQSTHEPLCFINVLNHQLQYGYEYVGSTDRIIPHTPSTECAKLGILLALTNFRCGLFNGPCKTLKTNLIIQLAMALGRMVFILKCQPSVRRATVENLLLGSLQTGAWLVLDSADLLSEKVSTILGQYLIEIQESFSKMTNKSTFTFNPMCNITVADKQVPALYNYGCIMVSSKAQTCNFPEELQAASRPVALTQPDYKFIAEVMLTSMGFVDAKYLSQRLVSLITFSKDCLPGCKTPKHNCLFLILQNIITSSEPYLEQSRKQRNLIEDNGAVFTVVQSLIEEAAVCKSILLVLLPWTHELNKVRDFQQLLKDTFPVVCQFPSLEHYLEEHEKSAVKNTILEVLQTDHLQPDVEILNNALTVYQHLKSGKAVILSGPSGSGKTSCHSVLARALNLMTTKSEKQGVASRIFVKPVVLFPNSMSCEELLGCDCDHRGWQDGALTTLLRTCGDAEGLVNWLVLDGEEPRNRVEESSWVDIIGTLYHSPDAFMCLASGEYLTSSQEHLKVLLELSDLSTASPSVVTAYSLVNFTGVEIWRSVWKSEMGKFYQKHYLNNVVSKMWEKLAEDLFPATLRLLYQTCMSPAVHTGSSRRPPEGLQEITSFFRIFNALVQHFEVCLDVHEPGDAEEADSRDVPPYGSYTTSTSVENYVTVLARNCFLMAFIWGFGGHLHPSLWPRFQCIVCEVLVKSRYQIQVPEGESVFEYFVTSDRRVCLQTTALTSNISPKYGIYTHLLNIMLKSRQPVLLVGEPGSGKSTVCRSLPSLRRTCVGLSGSAILGPSDLITVFQSIMSPTNLLLFVDDLHQAATDTAGTISPTLEVLRQSMSTGGVVLFGASTLRPVTTRGISYLCSSCVAPHSPPLSSRLTRLFSAFTLPALSADVILSLHSPCLQLWMRPLLPNPSEVASCIVSATYNLYLELQEHFGQYLFSIHDLQKVFQGMTLWQSNDPNRATALTGTTSIMLNIVKLWLHECKHTFMDRMCEQGQSSNLEKILANIATIHFGSMLEQAVLECPENFPGRDRTVDGVKGLILEYVRHSDVIYSPELPAFLKTEPNMSGSKQIAYKEYTVHVLTESLQNFLDKKTSNDHSDVLYGFLRAYAMHQQRARQLAHIFRALLIPGAHAVLIASDVGTGRRSTARCAALLSGSDLLEIHSANEKELCALLREAGDRSRVNGARVVVLVHEDVSVVVRERLLVAMAQVSPGLHTQEQITQYIATVTSTNLSQRYHLDQWMLDKFLGQTHKNVHVVMLLPHSCTGHAPSRLCSSQMRTAVRRSCCVEFYQPWSYQSLLFTAHHCLQISAYMGESVSSVAEAMAQICLCARQYASSLLSYQPFSPASYLQCVGHFCELFTLLQRRALQYTHRMEAVVSSLEEMTNMALERLLTQRKKVQAIQKEEDAVLRALTVQEQRLQDAQHSTELEEACLTQLEKNIQHTQLKVQEALEAGVRKVTSLDLCALEEMRGYRDPPQPVVMVLDAVCLLFHHPPGWDSAKHLLSREDFFQKLEYFDHCSVPTQQLQRLGTLVHSPAFDPELVREASQACESLCRWVLAVYQCCRLHKHVEKSRRLEREATAAQEHLHVARRQKEDACSQLKTLSMQLHSVQDRLLTQTSELEQAEQLHRKATCSVDQLGTYVTVWKEDSQQAAVTVTALAGDALLTAAALSYLGPFGSHTRCELVTKWKALCETGRMCPVPEDPRGAMCSLSVSDACGPCSPLLPVSPLPQGPLARALGLSERQLQGESLSRLLLTLLLSTCTHNCLQRCPLLVDPHHRLDPSSPQSWFRGDCTMAMKNFELEFFADDQDLLEKVEKAAMTGARVLVRATERAPSCPEFLSILFVLTGETHPSFSLAFSTALPVHRLTTEVPRLLLCRLHVVDLSLSTQELERFMQTQLLLPEGSLLLSQQQQLEQRMDLLKERLSSREASFMDYIVQSEGPLLEQPDFTEEVRVFHEETWELQRELRLVEDALSGCSGVLRSSQPLCALFAAMYNALQQVAVLSPAYCFSLEQFVSVMKKALSRRPGQGSLCPVQAEGDLSHWVVSQLLLHYGPCLSRSHAQVLKVLLIVALLQHRQLCSQAQSQAFLQGLQPTDHHHSTTWTCPGTCPETQQALPQWIPAHVLPQLWCLEQVPAFRGLLWSLSSAPEQWQEYLEVPSSVTGPVPFEPYTQLSLLQRALLWRTLKPEALHTVAEQIAGCLLSEVPCFEALQAPCGLLLSHTGPKILTWAPHTGLQPLHFIKQLALSMQVSLRVVCSWEQVSITSDLKNAPNEVLWLVFKNCHLLEQWERLLPEIIRLIHNREDVAKKPGLQRLQLWFIAPEDKVHLIPFVVRQHSLVLVLDSCITLREEWERSIQQLQCVSAVHRGQYLQRCALFHSVLLQRRTGPDHYYPWTETDLQVLVEAYSGIAALCSDQERALQYLAVSLVHGAHVLDTAHQEELKSVARVYLLLGPHTQDDASALMVMLNGHPQHNTGRDECLRLGFGEDVMEEVLQKKCHSLDVLLRVSQCPPGRSVSVSPLRCYAQSVRALEAYMSARARAPAVSTCCPLQAFLQDEWDILRDAVPSLASPMCPSPCEAELQGIQELQRRAEFLSSYLWHHNSPDQAHAYRLSAFANPTGLLLALRRHYAQVHGKNLSDTTLHFQIVSDDACPSSCPVEAVYLCGLELRGATWDLERGGIQDTQSAGSPLPLLCVSPGPVPSPNNPVPPTTENQFFTSPGNPIPTSQTNIVSPYPDTPAPLTYLCPLYVAQVAPSSLAVGQVVVVTWVPLWTRLLPETCALRRVRLVSTL